jgi:hypothetical protein
MEIKSKMKQEDKILLVKDLCSRLPYGVRVCHMTSEFSGVLHNISVLHMYEGNSDSDKYDSIVDYVADIDFFGDGYPYEVEEFKPYLFPLSSISSKQLKEVSEILGKYVEVFDNYLNIVDHTRNTFSYLELDALFDWFNKNHFDYRNLIEKGLAIDCTNLNIY